MAKLRPEDVDQIVREMNAFYQPADGKCVATPRQLHKLLNYLDNYTREVVHQADESSLSTDVNVAQWATDMADWEGRLAHYYQRLNQIPKEQWDTDEGCKAAYPWVTAPLLDGIYYEQLEGISLNPEEIARIQAGEGHSEEDTPNVHPPGHSNPKPDDVTTPFILGNQVLVYQEHQRERFRKFWTDLKDEAVGLYDKGKKAVKGAIDKAKKGWTVGKVLLAIGIGGGVVWGVSKIMDAGKKEEK